MTDIDKIIERLQRLLSERRAGERATFTERSYTDQPLIERGRDLKARMERREAEHAARAQAEAQRRSQQRAATSAQAVPPQTAPRQSLSDWMLSLDRDLEEAAGGRTAPTSRPAHANVPQPIRDMRRLEHGGLPSTLAYGSGTAASLFYRQACLMEAYEDDYDYHGYFSQYYPTYAAMTDDALRGYFSWRTRVRHGHVVPAPLSFAFVYVYELLMGIGTTPGEETLAALRAFGEAYRQTNDFEAPRLMSYLRRWMQDYAIYHGIATTEGEAHELAQAVLTLLVAEHALLANDGREPRIPNAAVKGEPPSPDQLFHALGAASTYRIDTARLAKDEPALLAQVTCDVFAALVSHCAKRRKTDFVEGLFGYGSIVTYTMFSAAVFYEPNPHPDAEVRVSPVETFTCTDGRWRRHLACEATARSSELGLLMHQVDFELRQQLGYDYPLKARAVPKYVERMVAKAVSARLAERAAAAEAQRKAREEAEARRITIDLGQLDAIRAAAALTQEALLTDDERDELPGASPAATVAAPAGIVAQDAQPSQDASSLQVTPPPREEAVSTAQCGPTDSEPVEPGNGPLSPDEARFLQALLAGEPTADVPASLGQFASVVADSINEKLFDLVGDAVIEFADGEPRIIEDYLDDVREVLHP